MPDDPGTRSQKCPRCQIAFNSPIQFFSFGRDIEGDWCVEKQICPSCGRFVLFLVNPPRFVRGTNPYPLLSTKRRLVRPKAILRGDAPQDLPPTRFKRY
jgi:hypothetical protein